MSRDFQKNIENISLYKTNSTKRFTEKVTSDGKPNRAFIILRIFSKYMLQKSCVYDIIVPENF